MELPERRAAGVVLVIRAIAALALLTASSATLGTTSTKPADATEALLSSAPWWEKVTVTLSGDGEPQSCRFESSLGPDKTKECEVDGKQASMSGKSASKGEYTRITFERRYTPGVQPVAGDLQLGDRLLGRQVMALAIDPEGAVKGCRIVDRSGAMTPDYGCEEASAERFKASAHDTRGAARQGTMTILVYGHEEHVA
jgi:hypothetical protein